MIDSTESALTVRRRDGSVAAFDRMRIKRALALAYLRDANGQPRHVGSGELLPAERDKVESFTEQVVHAMTRRPDATAQPIGIEDIQDQVELALMRYGEHVIARDYVLYRDSRRLHRERELAACRGDQSQGTPRHGATSV